MVWASPGREPMNEKFSGKKTILQPCERASRTYLTQLARLVARSFTAVIWTSAALQRAASIRR
eukprot:scaffold322301_cov32-Tisochrysis_lutea.AAC.1